MTGAARWLLLLALLTGNLWAQAPRGFYAWWDSPIVRDLNLSADQMQRIRTTVREYRGRLIDERAAIQKAEADLIDLFNDDKVDEKRVNDAIERLAIGRANLTRTLTQMSLKLRQVLTVEQWRELERRRPAGAKALKK
jgi:Spy/CpxP family protein refolding chaperone